MFLITAYRFHATRPRKCFWQTRWAWPNRNGELVEVGGWMPTSYHATLYSSQNEAENVSAFLGLDGEVIEVGVRP